MTVADVSRVMSEQRFFCSWSGGKDSCLSLYRAIRDGGVPSFVLTMMAEGGERSRSHGLRLDILRAQAAALGIPLVTRSASWGTYEAVFREAVRELAMQGITTGVFGDIDLDEHREWCVRVCREAGAALGAEAGAALGPEPGVTAGVQSGVCAIHPLWKMDRMDVVREFLDAGFQAYIVAMKDGAGASGNGAGGGLLDLLGKPFDQAAVDRMVSRGVDPCGEAGEFHTVATGGPLFKKPLRLRFGEPVLRDGYWFADAIPIPNASL